MFVRRHGSAGLASIVSVGNGIAHNMRMSDVGCRMWTGNWNCKSEEQKRQSFLSLNKKIEFANAAYEFSPSSLATAIFF